MKKTSTPASKEATSSAMQKFAALAAKNNTSVPEGYDAFTKSESNKIAVDIKINTRGRAYAVLSIAGNKLLANIHQKVDATKSYRVTHIRVNEDSDWQDVILQEKE